MLLGTNKQIHKQSQLNGYIKELSSNNYDENEIKNYINNLQKLYDGEFRHTYSRFYPLISDEISDISLLQENIQKIEEYINEQINLNSELAKDEFIKSLDKLIDHLNLEIVRYTKFNDIYESYKKLNRDFSRAKNDLKLAQKELDKSKIDIVAILSIFSAIIIAFTGGFSYSTSAFASIKDTPTLKLSFFVLIIGCILFNAIYLLMHIVGKVTNKDIKINSISIFNTTIILAIIINLIMLKVCPNTFN